MMKTVEFIFDFGSPNAYLAHQVLPDIAARAGVQFVYRPCLLGGVFKATGNQSPMTAFAGIPSKLAYEQLEMQRFIKTHGIDRFRFNPHFPVNTLMLMRGAIAAEAGGFLPAYVEAGFVAMWEQGLKMDDPAVFAKAFDDAGLDGAAILEKTQDPAVKQKLVENTENAVARGVFGVPTFFVGNEIFFGKDRLAQVEEALAG